jgi:hypothetical protein
MTGGSTNYSIKTGLGQAYIGGTLEVVGNVGFFNHAPAAQPTVSGSKGANVALASLIAGFVSLGLIADTTT